MHVKFTPSLVVLGIASNKDNAISFLFFPYSLRVNISLGNEGGAVRAQAGFYSLAHGPIVNDREIVNSYNAPTNMWPISLDLNPTEYYAWGHALQEDQPAA